MNSVKVRTEAHECFGLYFWVDRGWPRCPPLSGCSAGERPSLLPTHTDKQTLTSSLQKGCFSRTLSSSYHQSLPICLLKSSRSPSAVWPLQEQYEMYKYTVIIWHKKEKKIRQQASFYWENQGMMLEQHQICQVPVFSELEPQLKYQAWIAGLCSNRFLDERRDREITISTTNMGFRCLYSKPSCWCKVNLWQHTKVKLILILKITNKPSKLRSKSRPQFIFTSKLY